MTWLRDREEARLQALRSVHLRRAHPKHTELFPLRIRLTLVLWSQIDVQSVPDRLPAGSDEQDVAGHIRGGTSLRRLSAALVLALEVMMQPNVCDQKRGNSWQPWALITMQSTTTHRIRISTSRG